MILKSSPDVEHIDAIFADMAVPHHPGSAVLIA